MFDAKHEGVPGMGLVLTRGNLLHHPSAIQKSAFLVSGRKFPKPVLQGYGFSKTTQYSSSGTLQHERPCVEGSTDAALLRKLEVALKGHQMCDCILSSSVRRGYMTKPLKLDTMIFNLVLDACVRSKSSLKGQQLVEMMADTGVIADAHSIILIAQIHEMNGQRDDIKKMKDHMDQVSSSFHYHYRQFYDSLLSLYFKFDDIDAALELVLDMLQPRVSVPRENHRKDAQKPYLVPIGSQNLKSGLKLKIMPEMLQKDTVLKLVHQEEFVARKNGKLVLTNKGVAKLINGFKRHGRITELSKLLVCI